MREPVIRGPDPGSDTAAPPVCDPRQAPPFLGWVLQSLQWHYYSLSSSPYVGLPGEQSVFNLGGRSVYLELLAFSFLNNQRGC